MRYFLAYFVLFVGLFLPVALNCVLLRRWFRSWWRLRPIRLFMGLSAASCATIVGFVIAGPYLGFDPYRTLLGIGLALAWLPQAVLLFSLPLTALWLKIGNKWLLSRESQPATPVDLRRRTFLKTTTAFIPLAAVGTTVAGVAATIGGARSFIEPLTLPGLPGALRGLRILQVSDLHLGGFMLPEFLAQTLENARAFQPDLIVLTGDLADDYRLLPEALSMLEDFGAPLGIYAVLGNHEHGNGIRKFRSILASSSIQLLENSGRRIEVDGAVLYLAGVDDVAGRPVGADRSDYLKTCVETALQDRRPEDFVVLLSHRPQAFNLSAQEGVPLTLAGHTHGGQAALAGHSWLELVGAEKYAWGFYRRGDSLLYTSSGTGQWVPVRLGCPSEAPVFELG